MQSNECETNSWQWYGTPYQVKKYVDSVLPKLLDVQRLLPVAVAACCGDGVVDLGIPVPSKWKDHVQKLVKQLDAMDKEAARKDKP